MRLIADLKLPVNKINTKSFDELSTDKYRAAEVEEKYSVLLMKVITIEVRKMSFKIKTNL